MKTVQDRVQDERARQNKKWGVQDHNAVEWIAILAEEVGEASKEAVDFHFANPDAEGFEQRIPPGFNDQRQRIERLKTELIQVAAVAIQAVESIERQTE